MDIYNYLKNDHQKVNGLLEEIISTKDTTVRTNLFQQVKNELLIHAETENATFYNALRQFDEIKERIDHAEKEHDEMKTFLTKIGAEPLDSDLWMEQFGELKHAVTHHVEEEEGEIFEKAKKLLSAQQANQLATDMDALKQKALEAV